MSKSVAWLIVVALTLSACTSSRQETTAVPTSAPTSQTAAVVPPTAAATAPPAVAPVPTPTAPGPTPSPTLLAPVFEPEEPEPTSPLESIRHVGSVMVWTGDELIFWGGSLGFGGGAMAGSPGGAYEPASESWRELPPSPDGVQTEAVGLWTGTELLICCGKSGSSPARSTQLYNPATNTWRSLPPPPFDSLVAGASAVLANDRVYVAGPNQLLMLNLETEEWQELTAPDFPISFSPGPAFIAIADGGLVLWPRPSVRATTLGQHYDPALDTWTPLPAPPREAWPAIADLAWSGDELFVIGGLPGSGGPPEQLVGARLDWDSMTWRALPDVWPQPIPSEGNLGSQSIAWTGDRLVVITGSLGSGFDPLDSVAASYDPTNDQWFLLARDQGVGRWHPPLVQFDDRVVYPLASELFISEPGWASDETTPIPPSGLPASPRVEFDDLLPRTNTPLTIVGSTGNGADIVVIDLELGLRTVYDNTQHSLGAGFLTDMTLVDRDLFVWRFDLPTVRFDGGPSTWEGDGERLIFGELTQPATIVGAADGERIVFPVPALNASWVWTRSNEENAVKLAAFDGAASSVIAELNDSTGPFGHTRSGVLVVWDSNGTTSSVAADGSSVELGAGVPLAISGEEVLLQICDRDGCTRRWVDVQTANERPFGRDEFRWVAAELPTIPGNSPRSSAASPGGEQILIGRRLVSTPDSEYGLADMVRVDVEAGTTAVLPVEATVGTGAVWSRSGKQVIVFGRENNLIVIDIDSGDITTIRDAVPDGFFPLTAG